MKPLYIWDKNMIRWYRRAADYQNFHRTVAETLLTMIGPDDRVCDMGCGLGYLSMELAPHVKSIDAMDIKGDVIDMLEKYARARRLDNLRVRVTDFEASPPPAQRYDALIFSFFGELPRYFDRARNWTDGKLLVICNDKSSRGISGKRRQGAHCDSLDFEQYLRSRGADFRIHHLTVPFGQPFMEPAEAARFLAYYTDENEEEIQHHLREQLLPGGDSFPYYFPYYLPHDKKLMIFDINMQNPCG